MSRSGHGQGRRVTKRRKGISNIKDPIVSEQEKIIKVQQTPDDETLKVKHRIGLRHRRPTLIEDNEETETHRDKTTTVNPVLIWRQQAAVTEQGPPRSRVELLGRRGATGGRRRNIKRRNGGRKTENINTKQTSLEDNKPESSKSSVGQYLVKLGIFFDGPLLFQLHIFFQNTNLFPCISQESSILLPNLSSF